MKRPLAVPLAPRAHFESNFLKQVVCEFRFPTLFELESSKPPVAFAGAIRKEYPIYELQKDIKIDTGDGTANIGNAHSFKARKGHWSLMLRAAALSLEATRYESFAAFEERIAFVLRAAERVIDSDFFTRVGLRYINNVPWQSDDPLPWMNPELTGPLTAGLFGDVDEYVQRIRGTTDVGGFLFRHRLLPALDPAKQMYELDLDFYAEDVTVGDALATVRRLHDLEYSLFQWALGPGAKANLGPSLITTLS